MSWRILIWNLETREEEIRKAEAEAAFERKRNCIQPSKPADRLYKSQAADGLAFLLYTISGFTCAICLRLFIRK